MTLIPIPRALRTAAVAGLVLLCASWSPASAKERGPYQVGEEVFQTYASAHPYARAARNQEGPSERLTITFPGASYVAPHFSRFDLAAGDYVVVRSPDGSRSWSYQDHGKADYGIRPEGFWGIHIPGDTAIVELFAPSGNGYGFDIDKIARGFTHAELNWGPGDAPEAVCGTDDSVEAKCVEGTNPDYYEYGKAVARLLINGTGRCTGWLVGCEGHVMTNQHCIENETDAMNTDFEFMAEGADCATDCSSPGACAGTVEATSSDLIRVDEPLDYALVKLPTDPSGTYGFLQLYDYVPALQEAVYIPQHPAGWGKRFALESTHDLNTNPPMARIQSRSEEGCQDGPDDELGYYHDTQGGSSGSPVLIREGNSPLVVGLHHCKGTDDCTQSGGDLNRAVRITHIIDDLGDDVPLCGQPGGCEFLLDLPSETVRPGEVLSYHLRLVHLRREASESQMRMRIEDANGQLVQQQLLGTQAFEYLDDKKMRAGFRIPDHQPPGVYTLTIGLDQMLQGEVSKSVDFVVVDN